MKKRFTILITVALFIGLLQSAPKISPQGNNIVMSNDEFLSEIPPHLATWLTLAPPFTIDGDAGWGTCPWDNGSGSWEDPYVIANLTINASATGSGITILNTAKCFKIVNCTITGATAVWDDAGIHLENVGNGTLFNNTCHGNSMGMYLRATTNVTLVENNCSANTANGIYIAYASGNAILQNNCTGNSGQGISLVGASGNNVTQNTCMLNGPGDINISGIYLTDSSNSNNASRNTCSGNGYAGIYVVSASNYNVLEANTCRINLVGIGVAYSDYNLVSQNNVSSNTQGGILLNNAERNLVHKNNITGNGNFGGVAFFNSLNNNVTANTITKFITGVDFVSGNSGNRICGNWIRKTSTPIGFTTLDTIEGNVISSWAIVSFTSSASNVEQGTPVTFTDTTTDGSRPLKYQWNFGDGTSNDTAQHPSHAFSIPGTYNVTLTITDDDGDSASHSDTITVTAKGSRNPDGDFTWVIWVMIVVAGAGIAFFIIIRRKRR